MSGSRNRSLDDEEIGLRPIRDKEVA